MQTLFDSPESLLACFAYGDQPGELHLVSGPTGAGKTSSCMMLADFASVLDLDVAGLISPAVFECGEKIAIDLLDLRSGDTIRFADRHTGKQKDPGAMTWKFNPTGVTWGNEVLKHLAWCQLLILDELGPLEFSEGRGLVAGLELVSRRAYQLACVVIRPSLIDTALKLWPFARVRFVEKVGVE